MKTISDEQARLINDARAEGIVALRAAILEKDIVVTEVLRAITARTQPGNALTFAGGTCLSKAHRLVQRMSEDVDFRLFPDDLTGLNRTQQRKRLREFHNALVAGLRAVDFEIRDEDIHVRNERRNFSCELHYKSAYDADASLRPSVLIELTGTKPRLATKNLKLKPLIDIMTGKTTAQTVEIQCIAVEETYCEKIVSYLRRSAEHLAKRENSHYEERLARHVYDVHCIENTYFVAGNERPPDQFIRDLVNADAKQFGDRVAGFATDPVGVMEATLSSIGGRSEFKDHYDRFAADLVYGDNRPSFDEAFTTFRQSSEQMFAAYRRS